MAAPAPQPPQQLVLLLLLLLSALVTALAREGDKHYTATMLDSPIRDTVWVGESDQIVFTITEEGHLWRSTDGGLSWNDETHPGKSKLPEGLDAPKKLRNYNPRAGVQALYFHPEDARKIWFRGGSNVHWISYDSGASYKKVLGPAGDLGMMTIRLHPTERNWMLVMVRRWVCWASDLDERKQCADDLFVTQDFGITWKNLTESANGKILSFADFDWGWSKHPSKGYRRETILASVYRNRADVRKHLAERGMELAAGWDQYVDFVVSHDFFKGKPASTQPCGNQFEIMAGRVFLATAENCAGGKKGNTNGVKLKISKDYGYSFTDTCFPLPLSQRGYSVVDATEDAAYINVDYAQGGRGSPMGSVFVSDADFTLFSLALRRNTRSPFGTTDFTAVQGLPGVYIANQVVEDSVSSHGHKSDAVGTTEESNFAKSITLLSLNGGAEWQRLKPPSKDSEGRWVNCRDSAKECSLHLHGTTSWGSGHGFAFVYSHRTTPGLVISTGNVGSYLYEDNIVNTYLSRDGGQSWEEMRKGAFIYEFGDSGGVIVMAKHGAQGTADEVLYTLNEGMTWESINLQTLDLPQQGGLDIFNIRVEPDNQGKKFLVQCMTGGATSKRVGVLLAINFGQGFREFKGCGPRDYETWTPTHDTCLLGQNISYKRQVRAAKCWNGDDYAVQPRITPCPCRASDYQCDYGMERLDGHCITIPGFTTNVCPILAKKGYSFANSKMRVIAGDKCVDHIMKAGHYNPTKGSWLSGWYLFFVVSLVVWGVGGGAFAYLAWQGMIPDEWLQRLPFVERIRYHNMKSNFQSLAQDFGLGGGDEELNGPEEIYRRPS